MNDSADILITIISGTIILLLLLATIVSILFFYQNQQIRSRLFIKEIKDNYESEILKTKLEIKQQILKNISEDIHDNVGQILALANLTLSSIDLQEKGPAALKIETVMRLISRSIHDLRNLSKMIDPENIAIEGLSRSLETEVSILKKTGAFEIEFKVDGHDETLDSYKKFVLYRMVQESINNIIKHSKATTVDIWLQYDEQKILISVRDNGIGFDQELLKEELSGSGLRNMKHRAKMIGGALTLNSKPGKGTEVQIEIPKQ